MLTLAIIETLKLVCSKLILHVSPAQGFDKIFIFGLDVGTTDFKFATTMKINTSR